MELNDLKAPEELQINTVTLQTTKQNTEKTKPTCHHCKKPNHYRNKCCQLKREEEQAQNNTVTTTTIIMVRQIPTPTTRLPTIPTKTAQIIKKTENLDLSTHRVRPVVKLTIPQNKAILEQIELIDRLPGTDGRKDRLMSNKEIPKTIQMGMFKLQHKL